MRIDLACNKKIEMSDFQAGISTLVLMLPVLFAPVGAYVVIAKAVILVVIFGLLHGLFILPVLLLTLPNCLMSPKSASKFSMKSFS